MTDKGADGQNFHVERKMEGLACVKACRDTDGYSNESATQPMRQLVAPVAMVRHSLLASNR